MTILSASSKIIPVTGAVASIAVFADSAPGDTSMVWIIRGFISLCLAIVAYFLKQMIDDYRTANIKRDSKIEDLVRLTAAHDVMFEIWIEEQAQPNTFEGGQRKTDQVRQIISTLAQQRSIK